MLRYWHQAVFSLLLLLPLPRFQSVFGWGLPALASFAAAIRLALRMISLVIRQTPKTP
jgi:hypothetical protein